MAARSLRLTINILDHNPRKARVNRKEIGPLESYSENELRSRYRFGRDGLQFITDLLLNEIAPATGRSHSLSAKMKVLVTLRFLTSGSFLEVVGDTFLSFDKSTVSRVVHQVTQALAVKVISSSFPQQETNEMKSSAVCSELTASLEQ